MAISDSTAERYRQSDPDVRLMLRVRDDDDASAFEELMLRYQDRLVGVLTHLVRERELAEDLAQEVFLRIYRARKTYKPGAKFSTWLFTIANNASLNALRTLSRRKEVHIAPPPGQTGANALDVAAVAASGLMPTRLLDKAELCDVVHEAIGTLSERQRLAVLLNKFEHLSYAEIANVMDLSPQAIKSLLSRARTNLREVLEPYLEE